MASISLDELNNRFLALKALSFMSVSDRGPNFNGDIIFHFEASGSASSFPSLSSCQGISGRQWGMVVLSPILFPVFCSICLILSNMTWKS